MSCPSLVLIAKGKRAGCPAGPDLRRRFALALGVASPLRAVHMNVTRDSLWAPLASSRFRPLWAVQLTSSVALWAHVLTGQWVLTTSGESATAIASIQTALTLPFFLLALPAGLVADTLDRRRVLVVVQAVMAAAAGVLAGLVFAERVSPSAVIASTCFLGAGSAVAWQSLIPELVERPVVPSAAVLDGMSFNASRAIGPALAGVVLSLAGAGWLFAAVAVAFVLAAAASGRWAPTAVGAKATGPPPALRRRLGGARQQRSERRSHQRDFAVCRWRIRRVHLATVSR